MDIVYDPRMMEHETPPGHPECSDRLVQIVHAIDSAQFLKPVWHTPDEVHLRWVETVHSRAYIRRIEEACLSGETALDADTGICDESFTAARLAAGSALRAVDLAMEKNAPVFAAVRPPGHHACHSRAMGFCLFNNCAIAARYAQNAHGCKRVLIIDWDVHHGNGTQDAFYNDPSVLFFSCHQHPLFPGTGAAEETGGGRGLGYTINVPLPPGTDGATVRDVFEERLLPAASEFAPDLVLLSAGFDAHREDPLGGLHLEDNHFSELAMWVRVFAKEYCGGRVVSILEGGYNLDVLGRSVVAHLEGLGGRWG